MSRVVKNIFLIDGLGAVASSVIHGLILTQFNQYIGMPLQVLYGLSLIAVVFALYSLSHHFWFKSENPKYLKLIAYANLVYCVVTLVLTTYFFERLTTFGISYFITEILVVVGLVGVEMSVVKKMERLV